MIPLIGTGFAWVSFFSLILTTSKVPKSVDKITFLKFDFSESFSFF